MQLASQVEPGADHAVAHDCIVVGVLGSHPFTGTPT
jgi:hypothetical protein